MARTDPRDTSTRRRMVRSGGAGAVTLVLVAAGCVGSAPSGRAPTADDRGTARSDAAGNPEGSVDDWVVEAAARWREGDAATCERLLREALAREPNHREGRMLLADLLADQGRVDEAERELSERLRVDPRDAQAHHSLGLLLESAGRPDQAIASYRNAVHCDPENPLYILSLETLRVGASAKSPNGK